MAWLAGDRDTGPPRPAPPPPTCDGAAARASDAERDQVLTELGDGFATGRLSHETFVFRVEATLRARRRPELDHQIADLPPPAPARPALAPPGPARLGLEPVAERARELRAAARAAVRGWRRPAPPALVLPAGPAQRYTIGREWACDMSIGHPTVSRWHADLCRAAGGWRLADLGSLNGTRLNGWRVTAPVLVRPGDLVSFGTVTFVLMQPPAAAP